LTTSRRADSSESMLAAGPLLSFAIDLDILVPMFWQFLQMHFVILQVTPREKQSQYFLRHLRRTTGEESETLTCQLRRNVTSQPWIPLELTCSSCMSNLRQFSSGEE
jgi:hypothetical protein